MSLNLRHSYTRSAPSTRFDLQGSSPNLTRALLPVGFFQKRALTLSSGGVFFCSLPFFFSSVRHLISIALRFFFLPILNLSFFVAPGARRSSKSRALGRRYLSLPPLFVLSLILFLPLTGYTLPVSFYLRTLFPSDGSPQRTGATGHDPKPQSLRLV